MNELLAWLKQQNGGIGTYGGFQQRVLQLASEQPEHAALFQLLWALSNRFVTSYEGMPLQIAVGNQALTRLISLVQQAAEAMNASAESQLRLLNEVAQADLG